MITVTVTLRPEEVAQLAGGVAYAALADLGLEELRVRAMTAAGMYAEGSTDSLQKSARLRDYERRNRWALALLEKRDALAHTALLEAVERAVLAGADYLPEVPR